MYLTQLVSHYGYAAVFVGSVLEGESVLLLAGLAAHRGYLSFIPVVALAFCGGTLGDQILFHLGRRYGVSMLRRSPAMAARVRPVARMIRRHQAALIIGVRFMYGLRLIGPFAIGMTEVSAFRFARLNMLGAALWAPLFTGLGYLFGQTLQWLVADLDRYEGMALLVGIAVAAAAGLVRWLCLRRRQRAP